MTETRTNLNSENSFCTLGGKANRSSWKKEFWKSHQGFRFYSTRHKCTFSAPAHLYLLGIKGKNGTFIPSRHYRVYIKLHLHKRKTSKKAHLLYFKQIGLLNMQFIDCFLIYTEHASSNLNPKSKMNAKFRLNIQLSVDYA